MTQHLSIGLDFHTEHITRDMIEPLFTSDFFRPLALGGLDVKHNWFLSGYALEDFFARLHWGGSHKPASIQLAPQNPPMTDYLSAIADHMNALERPVDDLSPFEEVDPQTGVTYVNAELDPVALDAVTAWFGQFDCVHLAVIGALRLAVTDAASLPWSAAYQTVELQDGVQVDTPLLTFDIRITPRIPHTVSAVLQTSALVWLQNAGALSGRIGAAEADHNLTQLGGLAKALSEAGPNLELSEITLQGDAYRAERVRLLNAFGSLRHLEIDTG